MSSTITFNSTSYSIPSEGDSNWSTDVSAYLIAISTGALSKAGGSFTLTADVNFGATYGLKLAYIKSQAANPSSSGIVRLGNTEAVSWRNAANNADLALSVNASDILQFNGSSVLMPGIGSIVNADVNASAAIAYSKLNLSGSIVNADVSASAAIAYSKLNLSSSLVDADINAAAAITYSKLNLSGSIVNADVSASAAIAYSKLNLATSIVNADINASATIDRSKLASGTASHVLINDGTGVMSSEAQLDKTRGGTGISSTATFPSSGTVVTRDATETLTNKTLTSPSLTTPSTDVVTLDGQASTPASPSSGFYKLFVSDTTQKLSLLDSAGTVTAVGSSGTGVNFIVNGDAEAGTTGVAVYADASSTRPVDGSGGAANVSITASSSSPISGAKSFILSKDAANRQGQGWSIDFSVDVANKAKVQTISFDYMVNSGTFVAGSSSTESDVIVYIYDVTNAVLIEPSNIKLFSSSTSLSDRYVSTFQTSSNSTSYRLIFHVQSTSALAYELKLDNISVSPQGTTLAPVITDWKSYTPTISTGSGTMTNYAASGLYSRNGDSINISGTISFSGAVGTWTNPSFSLPSGLSVDESKLANQYLQIIGTVTFLDFGVITYKGVVRYAKPSNTLEIMYLATVTNDAGSATDPAFFTGASSTAPFSMASGDEISFTVSNLPILGWSSGLEIGDNYSGREIVAAYTTATGTLGGSSNVVKFTNKTTDLTNSYDTSTGLFTIPSSGRYKIHAQLQIAHASVTVNQNVQAQIVHVSGSTYTYKGFEIVSDTGVTYYTPKITYTIDAKAGDTVGIYSYSSGTTPSWGVDNATTSLFTIEKLASPAAIASGEKVAARYTTNAGQSVTDVTTTTILFEDKDFDTHGAYNTSSGMYTAPIAGFYKIDTKVTFNDTASVYTYEKFIVSLYKNSVEYLGLGVVVAVNAANEPTTVVGSDTIFLNAGDTIDIRAYISAGASTTLVTSGIWNSFSITKL